MSDAADGRSNDLARAIAIGNEQAPTEFGMGQIMEALSQLPEERRDQLTSILVSEYHSGPLPSPRALAGYEIVSPGLAREIVDMAVRQQQHDQALQNKVLSSESSYRILTLIAATAVILGFAAAAVVLGIYGQTGAAIALGSASGLTIVAGAFLKGRDLFLPGTSAPPPPAPNEPKRTAKRPRRK